MRLIRAGWGVVFLIAAAVHGQQTEWRLTEVRQSLTGTHHHYQQFIGGVEVIGGGRTVTVWQDGRRSVEEKVAIPRMPGRGGSRTHARPSFSMYLNLDGVARPVVREVVELAPLERHAIYLDAETGVALRREPLFYSATGRVFPVNPVTALNQPALQDQNDAADAVPPGAYRDVELAGLESSGELAGPHVVIVDTQLPATTRASAALPLRFDRSQEPFEEVNVYWLIDTNQRYLQSLGYTGMRSIARYPIPVDPHGAGGADTSYYIQAAAPGRGLLFFGDGGTDDAEDADLVIHEYAHALHDWIAPGTFAGATSSQARAIAEGFGDYWAFSAKHAAAVASGRDPFCIADWDARCWLDNSSEQCAYPPGSDCLRRVDSAKTMADYRLSDASGTEHRNGEIWSSALREMFLTVTRTRGATAGKRAVDTIVLESMFGAPPNPTFQGIAQRMIAADQLLGSGASPAICEAMVRRGILAASQCGEAPRGEITWLQSPRQGIRIGASGAAASLVVSDTRAIEKLFVFVDIEHPSRGDLRIVIVAPDGTEYVLQEVTEDRTRDLRATYGLDAATVQSLAPLLGRSAAGEWRLRVEDRVGAPEGILRSWSLVVQFVGDVRLERRPFGTGQIIPIVGHVIGVGGERFQSDVRLFNRGTTAVVAEIVFTRAGSEEFFALKTTVQPKQIVALDDVVSQHFRTSGLGWIAVNGVDVIATSRSYSVRSDGTRGAFIPAASPFEVQVPGGSLFPAYLGPLENSNEKRSVLRLLGLSFGGGPVHLRFYDARTGLILEERRILVSPFQMVELTPPGEGLILADVAALTSGVAMYGAVIDKRSGDFTYVRPIVKLRSGGRWFAPVIDTAGAGGKRWTSDLVVSRLGVPSNSQPFPASFRNTAGTQLLSATFVAPKDGSTFIAEVLPGMGLSETFGLLRLDLPSDTIASSVVRSGDGTVGAEVDHLGGRAITLDSRLGQHLPFIESSVAFRTNIGVGNGSSGAIRVRVLLHDSAGAEIASRILELPPLGLVQVDVATMASPVVNARASIELLSASETAPPIVFYASVVDNRSGDPIFIPAQPEPSF